MSAMRIVRMNMQLPIQGQSIFIYFRNRLSASRVINRLKAMIGDVPAGRQRGAPNTDLGSPRIESGFWSADGRSQNQRMIDQARQLLAAGDRGWEDDRRYVGASLRRARQPFDVECRGACARSCRGANESEGFRNH